MQGPMLKVAPPQCLTIESFIYISCCRKYIRMMNGLRPFAELCMDVCYADIADNCLALANGRFCEAGRIDCLYRLSKFDKIIGLTLLD